MKQITDYITITEALAKDVKVPRKGSTVYLLKDGDTKAIPVKVADVTKVRNSWYGSSKGYDVYVELEENEYNFTGWMTSHYNDPALDKPLQVEIHGYGEVDGPTLLMYVGTSKEAISDYIKSDATKKLNVVLSEIQKAEAELEELKQKKSKLEIKINTEITESLNK